MDVITFRIIVESEGHTHIVDVSDAVQSKVREAGLSDGVAHLFVIGSTVAITTTEYEPGLISNDMSELFDRFAPYDKVYAHNRTWGDDNGASHLRAALIGPSLTVPFEGERLLLGSWQQIVLIDFDTRPRSREIVCQLHGIKR